MVVIFEARDSAGKGGVIKRITQRLNPRVCRSSPAPARAEMSANGRSGTSSAMPRIFRPAAKLCLFDRSWYNRAGVERVMEFGNARPRRRRVLPYGAGIRADAGPVRHHAVPDRVLHHRRGVRQLLFTMRIYDPLKQWKLSPMDVEARTRVGSMYTKAKEIMLERTHIPEAPWWVVEAVDKKRARLNCISHLLSQIPHQEVSHQPWSRCCGCAIPTTTAGRCPRRCTGIRSAASGRSHEGL